MLKMFFSFIALSTLMVSAANFLVDRGFERKEHASERLPKALAKPSYESKLKQNLKANAFNATKPATNKAAAPAQEEAIKPLALSEEDFIPTFQDENEEIKNDTIEEPSFVKASKNVQFGADKIKAPSLAQFEKIKKETIKKKNKEIRISNLEINGEEPVKLFGFKKGKRIKPSSLAAAFSPINLDEKFEAKRLAMASQRETNEKINKLESFNEKSEQDATDRISTALAANEKSYRKEPLGKNVVKSELKQAKSLKAKPSARELEDLVFFDYSKSESAKKTKDKGNDKPELKKAKTQIAALASHSGSAKSSASPSPNKEAIAAIMKGMGNDFKANKAPKIAQAGKDSKRIPSQEMSSQKALPEHAAIESASAFKKKVSTHNYRSSYRLTTQSRNINGKNLGTLKDYEIRFSDDIDDIQRSDSSGILLMENILNTEYAVRRGTIFSSGHYPTAVDFTLEEGQTNLSMPLVTEESFNSMLEREGLTGIGGHILIELDQLTEDVELGQDAVYERKLFLDRSMKVVQRTESDYNYILFVGVEAGNKILSFKTYKNEVTSKIVHVARDEIYFDFNFYAPVKNDSFALYEDNLLSQEAGILPLDEEDMVDLQYDSKINQKTVNRLEVRKALYPVGSRKYYELKHLSESVFVGRWSSDYIEVPSESYMRFALSHFRGYTLENSCMIQINLEKQAKRLTYNGNSFRGPMVISARILDTDGVFYKDLSHQSKRIFLLGEEQGAVSVKIEYVDDSVDYLQSFCSKANYVVEQL